MALEWTESVVKPSRIPVRDLSRSIAAPSRGRKAARLASPLSRIPVREQRASSVIRRPELAATVPAAKLTATASRARNPYYPTVGRDTKPCNVRGLLMSRSKPRPAVQVFKEVVLNLRWDQPEVDSTPSLEVAREVEYLGNALAGPRHRPSDREMNSHFNRVKWALRRQGVIKVPRGRQPIYLVPGGPYELGEKLVRGKHPLTQYKYSSHPTHGLNADPSETVFFNPDYCQEAGGEIECHGFVWFRDRRIASVSITAESEVFSAAEDFGSATGPHEAVFVSPSLLDEGLQLEPADAPWRIFSSDIFGVAPPMSALVPYPVPIQDPEKEGAPLVAPKPGPVTEREASLTPADEIAAAPAKPVGAGSDKVRALQERIRQMKEAMKAAER